MMRRLVDFAFFFFPSGVPAESVRQAWRGGCPGGRGEEVRREEGELASGRGNILGSVLFIFFNAFPL